MIRKYINRLITKLKGDTFELDKDIPLSYIFMLCISRLISLIYGIIRLRMFKRIFISPSVKLVCPSKMHFGKNVSIERGCYIDALSKEGLFIGDNCSIGLNTTIKLTGSIRNMANKVVIGKNVGLGTHGYYGCGVGNLIIGDDTIIGNYVSFHPENHNYEDHNVLIRLQGVNSNGGGIKIGRNCWIGAKATFLDGAQLGDNCIVAAGAVVNKAFPDNVIIGGVPARIIKQK